MGDIDVVRAEECDVGTPQGVSELKGVVREQVDYKSIGRSVMADAHRPCLYGVAGPCFHPNCLNAHYETLRSNGLMSRPATKD